MTTTVSHACLPFALTPSEGSDWSLESTGLSVTADPHSDIFIDPGEGGQLNAESLLNAVTLLGVPPAGDFQFRARVTVDFASSFDAGVLLLWFSERRWAKLCFEFSPDGQPMVVSVVNRDVADDANAFPVDAGSVWLRVSRIDRVWAFHASLDGTRWRKIRVFVLDGGEDEARVGFEAQSPTGEGCAVRFDDIRFDGTRLSDLRDGS